MEVNTNALKAEIVGHGFTMKDVYTEMGLSRRQFQCRMSAKKFWSNEIKALIKILNLKADDVMRIFFTNVDAQE